MLPEHFSVKELWDGQIEAWGPDLALLEVAPSYVSTIKTYKSFLNLSRQKAELAKYPPNIEKGFWAITGMVEEFSNVQHHPEIKTVTANVICRAFFSTIHKAHDHKDYDYIDAGAKLELPDVPLSFGGISGGGLWQVDLSMDKSGTISWDGKRHFRGVAFWQSKPSDGRRVIRCHGPRSVFEKAWTEWELPKSA